MPLGRDRWLAASPYLDRALDPRRPSDIVGETTTQTHELMAARATSRASTPASLRKLLQGDLDTIVAKALKKRPQERYASAAALADDIERHLSHRPIAARPDSRTYRADASSAATACRWRWPGCSRWR